MATRTLSGAMQTAVSAAEGYADGFLVELEFGTTVKAKAGQPTVPDCRIKWETVGGSPLLLTMQVSLNDGGEWLTVEATQADLDAGGAVIPGIAVGDVLTGRKLQTRVLWGRPGTTEAQWEELAGVRLMKVEWEINFSSGEQVLVTETGATLEHGQLLGTYLDGSAVAVRRNPCIDISSSTINAGRIIIPPPPDWDGTGTPTGTHVGYGKLYTFVPNDGGQTMYYQRQDPDRPRAARHDAASFGLEFWALLRNVGDNRSLFTWETYPLGRGGRPFVGSEVYLNNGKVHWSIFTADVVTLQTRGGSIHYFAATEHVIKTPDNYFGTDTPNRWVHIGISFDGLYAELYIDGFVASRWALDVTGGQEPDRDPVIPTDGGLSWGYKLNHGGIGGVPSGGVVSPVATSGSRAAADALIDEIRVWSTALSPGKVAARMWHELSDADIADLKAKEGLVAYYRLNDGTGTVIADTAAAANGNGSIVAPVWENRAANWFGATDPSTGYVATPARISPGYSVAVPGTVVRYTTSPHPVTWNGKTWVSVAGIGYIREIRSTSRTQPVGVELGLNGLDPANISLALGQEYIDRPARIYRAYWDVNGALVADPVLVFEGLMDTMTINSGAETASVIVTAESHLMNWERPVLRRWSENDQRERYNDDASLEFVDEMVDRDVWWPQQFDKDEASTP